MKAQEKLLRLSVTNFQIAAMTMALLILSATTGQSAFAQTYTVLYRFSGQDGQFPQARLILDTNGNGYGTAMDGGANGNGTLFTLSSKRKTIYSFTGSSGSYPIRGLVRDAAGNIYGTTTMGGTWGSGTVFKLDTKGNETVLYSFTGSSDGDQPQSGLLIDPSGNLYGMTVLGGNSLFGTVFKVDTAGHQTVLHSFSGASNYDGEYPYAGLSGDPSGNLYGTTGGDGSSAWGTIFKIDATGRYTSLYSFTGGLDGAQPMAGLVQDNSGNLYSTTRYGGAYGNGTVFKLDANNIETVLYSFTGGADGSQPQSGLVRDSEGNFYGTTIFGGMGFGTVFKLDILGNETVLHSFSGGSDGQYPRAGLVRDKKGNLYGTTSEGGKTYGTIFKITP